MGQVHMLQDQHQQLPREVLAWLVLGVYGHVKVLCGTHRQPIQLGDQHFKKKVVGCVQVKMAVQHMKAEIGKCFFAMLLYVTVCNFYMLYVFTYNC
jgi:hypothetical protein